MTLDCTGQTHAVRIVRCMLCEGTGKMLARECPGCCGAGEFYFGDSNLAKRIRDGKNKKKRKRFNGTESRSTGSNAQDVAYWICSSCDNSFVVAKASGTELRCPSCGFLGGVIRKKLGRGQIAQGFNED